MSHPILLPSKLKTVREDSTKGQYEIEGLYPGYGHTLGNALRRIILSSIPGSAITKIRIKGADHQYSTLDGIKEDVLTIVLHLRRLRFRMHSSDPVMVSLKVAGEKVVLGGDFDLPGQIELMNQDQLIATLTDKKASLEIDLTVEQGLGFVPKVTDKKNKAEVGEILVDASFTPIRRVNYEVENMRVGDRTDHNLLRINIETDGSLTPREALEYALKSMIQQLRAILDLKEEEETPISVADIEAEVINSERNTAKEKASSEAEEDELASVLKTRIDTVDLSTRTKNALQEASIRTLGGLVQKTSDDLLSLEGIGEKGVEEVRDLLKSMGLDLKD